MSRKLKWSEISKWCEIRQSNGTQLHTNQFWPSDCHLKMTWKGDIREEERIKEYISKNKYVSLRLWKVKSECFYILGGQIWF